MSERGTSPPSDRTYLVRLSTKGQLVVPKEVRLRHGWSERVELVLEDEEDRILLRSARRLPRPPWKTSSVASAIEGPQRPWRKWRPQSHEEPGRAGDLVRTPNVLVRVFTADDPDQPAVALETMRTDDLWVCKTALLETEWVLRYSYELSRETILEIFRRLLGYRNMTSKTRTPSSSP